MSKKGIGGFGGMSNLVKQAQKMQKDMKKLQEELENAEFTATSGGGAVEATVNGKKVLKNLKIDKDVVDSDDVETLEDLVMAAVNEAVKQADNKANSQMTSITGGINLPGGMF